MEIAVRREGPRNARITVERDDGVRLAFRNPGSQGRLPHDLAHYVVESELGLERGFWGELARGRVYPGMTVTGAPPGFRHRHPDPRAAEGSQGREGEVLVRLFTTIWTGAADREYGSVRAFLDASPAPRRQSRSQEIDDSTIRRVTEALDEIKRRWDELADDEPLALRWPPNEPASPRRQDRRRASSTSRGWS